MSDMDAAALLGLEPGDLDGHTVDELSDYLDRDRTPADPSIDNSPACQIVLAALQRLRAVADEFLDDVPAPGATSDQDWIARVLAVLPLEARAGRSFPFDLSNPAVEAAVTEGALRGFVRTVGDAIPGLLVGSVRIEILDGRPRSADLVIEGALRYGTPLPTVDRALRVALARDLPRHLPLEVRHVHLRIVSLIMTGRRP